MSRCSLPVLSSSFNLTLSAIGAGLLSFPYAFTHSGLAVSLGLNVAMALLNAFVVYVLFAFTSHAFALCHEQRAREEGAGVAPAQASGSPVRVLHERLRGKVEQLDAGDEDVREEDGHGAAHWVPLRTYEEMVGFYLGRRLFALAAFCAVVNIVGALLGYLVIIGDIGTPVVEHWFGHGHWYTSRTFLILGFAATVAFPLSNLRSFKELTCASVIAIGSVVVVAVGLAIRAGQTIDREGGLPAHAHLSVAGDGAFVTLPIFMFAYSCTLAIVPIYAELPKVSRARTGFMTALCMATCCITYSVTGAAGYIIFGRKAKGDILSNYLDNGLKDHLMTVAAAVMALHVILAFPVILFPARRSLRVYFFRPIARLFVAHAAEHDSVSFFEHTLQTVLIVGTCAGVACLVPQVSSVFGLVGGFSSTFLSIVLPFALLASRHGFGNGSVTGPVTDNDSTALLPRHHGGGERTRADELDDGRGLTAWPGCGPKSRRPLMRVLAAVACFLGVCFSLYATTATIKKDVS